MLIGYARASTADQDLALQADALTRAGCEKLVTRGRHVLAARGAARRRFLRVRAVPQRATGRLERAVA